MWVSLGWLLPEAGEAAQVCKMGSGLELAGVALLSCIHFGHTTFVACPVVTWQHEVFRLCDGAISGQKLVLLGRL